MTRTATAVCVALVAVAGCGGTAEFTTATFVTTDGFQLSGRQFGQGDRAVVLAPPEQGDQGAWSGFAHDLAAKGLRVLTFDARGVGSSQGERSAARADRDVAAAVGYLHSRVAVVGTGAGGLAALKAVAGGAAVAGVATLSAPTEYQGLSVDGDLAKVLVPKLYLASDDDRPAVEATQLLLRLSPEPRTVITYPGAAHGIDLLANAKAKDDLVAFLTGALQ